MAANFTPCQITSRACVWGGRFAKRLPEGLAAPKEAPALASIGLALGWRRWRWGGQGGGFLYPSFSPFARPSNSQKVFIVLEGWRVKR